MAVLPKAGYSAVELARSFKLSDHNALKRPYDSDLELNIPRFNASAHYNSLIDIFKEMGLNKYTHLDKMGMTDMEKELFAIQKNSMQIDEEGAKLAATTVVGGYDTALPPSVIARCLTFDRPFLFFVENMVTGTIPLASLVNNLGSTELLS